MKTCEMNSRDTFTFFNSWKVPTLTNFHHGKWQDIGGGQIKRFVGLIKGWGIKKGRGGIA